MKGAHSSSSCVSCAAMPTVKMRQVGVPLRKWPRRTYHSRYAALPTSRPTSSTSRAQLPSPKHSSTCALRLPSFRPRCPSTSSSGQIPATLVPVMGDILTADSASSASAAAFASLAAATLA